MRVAVLCLLIACGDNDDALTHKPDAPIVIDAAPDGPSPPPGCSWGEQADIDNHTTPEATHLTLGTQLVMCGRVDIGHTNESTMVVDEDAFGFTLTAPRTIRATLTGGLQARTDLAIVNRFGDPLATSTFVGAHAVVAATLPAGEYGVAVAMHGTEPASAIDYKVAIADAPPCAMPSTIDYTESAADNDVVEVRYGGDPALRRVLTAAADAPEATGITLAQTARIQGTSADVDAPDDFHDRDTYAVTTGAIDTLTVRVDWNAPTVDLDLLVFTANTLPELAGATHVATSGPEMATLAVAPSTPYWIWIGSYDSSSGLPVTYDVSLCAQ